jgi:hypothetical protein
MFSEFWGGIGLLAVLAFSAWGMRRISPQDPEMRLTVCIAVQSVNLLYLVWRWTRTLPPDVSPQTWLAWAYLLIETLALMESGIFWLCMSRMQTPAGQTPPRAGQAPKAPGAPPRAWKYGFPPTASPWKCWKSPCWRPWPWITPACA